MVTYLLPYQFLVCDKQIILNGVRNKDDEEILYDLQMQFEIQKGIEDINNLS